MTFQRHELAFEHFENGRLELFPFDILLPETIKVYNK